MCPFPQICRWWLALRLKFSIISKKSHWISVFPVFSCYEDRTDDFQTLYKLDLKPEKPLNSTLIYELWNIFSIVQSNCITSKSYISFDLYERPSKNFVLHACLQQLFVTRGGKNKSERSGKKWAFMRHKYLLYMVENNVKYSLLES